MDCMGRQNSIPTCKLQLTVDSVTDRIVGEIVGLGIHGANKAEVASTIIRLWIWENEDRLSKNGISVSSTSRTVRRSNRGQP
jgi:hypothetical protein